MKKYLSFAGLAVVVLGIVFFALRSQKDTADKTQENTVPAALTVQTLSLSNARSSRSERTFPATLSSESEATLVAQTSGTVVSEHIALGSAVGTGQLLYRIDTTGGSVSSQTGFESDALLQAKLALKNAEESYGQAKKVYDRDKSSANKTDRDIKKNLRDIATSQYASLLDAHTVKSPIRGIVSVKSASVGDTVTPGTPLATISAGKKIVRFSVSADDRKLFTLRQPLTFLEGAETDEKGMRGFVSKIAPIADASSKKFLVEAESSESAFSKIPSGTLIIVTTSLTRNAESGSVLLPLSALIQEQNGNFVFLADNATAKKVPVTLKAIYGETVAVSGTFDPDTHFIVSNVKRLSDGNAITTQE